MQVILLERIGRTGKLGDVVNVKSGFARNFLIPQGKAQMATKANIEAFEHIRAELEAKEADSRDKAQRTFEQLNGTTITIAANASEEGKLYGSVSAQDIVAGLETAGFSVAKRDVNLDVSIRSVGEYEVGVELWSDITAKITVVVEAAEHNE
jgi:large subunit ribosomal protein L9